MGRNHAGWPSGWLVVWSGEWWFDNQGAQGKTRVRFFSSVSLGTYSDEGDQTKQLFKAGGPLLRINQEGQSPVDYYLIPAFIAQS